MHASTRRTNPGASATAATMRATTVTSSIAAGPAKNHQCGRRSTTTSSPVLSSFLGNATRGSVGSLSVDAASEDAVARDDPVEEQQTVEVVELVLHSTRLEGVEVQRALLPVESDAAHDQRAGAAHVAGQVGHAHAALTPDIAAVARDDDGVEEHHLAVTRARLGVAGDVDAERASRHADLRRRDTDRVRRPAHGVDEVASELPGDVVELTDGCAHAAEHGVREAPDRDDQRTSASSG